MKVEVEKAAAATAAPNAITAAASAGAPLQLQDLLVQVCGRAVCRPHNWLALL